MSKTPTHIFLLFALLLPIAPAIQSCGEDEKNQCEKARDIQKRICRESNSEKCFPCPCYLRGEVPEWVTNDLGMPDPSRSICVEPEPCEGEALDYANSCIEDERTCDPRVYWGIWLFDEGEPEPPFPEICYGDW